MMLPSRLMDTQCPVLNVMKTQTIHKFIQNSIQCKHMIDNISIYLFIHLMSFVRSLSLSLVHVAMIVNVMY